MDNYISEEKSYSPSIKNKSIYIDENVVGGVVDFSTSEEYMEKTISEYLRSEPYAVIASKKTYKVSLKLLGNNKSYGDNDTFTLTIYNNREHTSSVEYKGCTVISDNLYTLDGNVYRGLVIGCGERRVVNG